MSMEARYCKSCKLAFIGKVCTGGHPNFKYSKAIPAGIEIPEGATVAPAPAPPRAARSWPGGASGDLQSAASAPAGGAPSWANRTNKTRSWSDPKSPVLNASGGAGSNLPPPPPGSPRGKSGSAGDARTARLEMFLTATEAAREKHDADRDLCQEAIAALKAAAGADATAKKSPEDSALRLKTAVLYARADHLLIMATTDTSGKVAVKVKIALVGKHSIVKKRMEALAKDVDAAALAAAVSKDSQKQEDRRLSEAVAGVMAEWDEAHEKEGGVNADSNDDELETAEASEMERELHAVARTEQLDTAQREARAAADAGRDIVKEAIGALKAAAEADAAAKNRPAEEGEEGAAGAGGAVQAALRVAVLYSRADRLLQLATADATGSVVQKVKQALEAKHAIVLKRIAKLKDAEEMDVEALAAAVATDVTAEEEDRIGAAVDGIMTAWDKRWQDQKEDQNRNRRNRSPPQMEPSAPAPEAKPAAEPSVEPEPPKVESAPVRRRRLSLVGGMAALADMEKAAAAAAALVEAIDTSEDENFTPPPTPEKKSEDVAQAADSEAGPIIGGYKALEKAKFRAGVELDSEVAGALEAGEVIDVLEVATLKSGQVRLRFERGWISLASQAGKTLLVNVIEFEMAVARATEEAELEAERAAADLAGVQAKFAELDQDGSGGLDGEEVGRLVKELTGKKLSKGQLKKAMRAMDTDGSGVVEFDEFRVWWEDHNNPNKRKGFFSRVLATPAVSQEDEDAEEPEAAEEEPEEAEPIEAGDKVKVLKGATVRESAGLESEQTGALLVGSVVEVLEVLVLDDPVLLEAGRTRIRCSQGWASVRGKSGSVLLAKTDPMAVEKLLDGSELELPAKSAFEELDIREKFDLLDADGSGGLDGEEVGRLVKELTGGKLSKGQLKKAMRAMDTDGSGVVEFDEFRVWWEDHNDPNKRDGFFTLMKQYDVKTGGKKYQLSVGGMGLQLFDSKGKPTDTFLYKVMAGWGDENGAVTISFLDGRQVVSIKSDDAEEIAEAMKVEARKLSVAKRLAKAETEAAAALAALVPAALSNLAVGEAMEYYSDTQGPVGAWQAAEVTGVSNVEVRIQHGDHSQVLNLHTEGVEKVLRRAAEVAEEEGEDEDELALADLPLPSGSGVETAIAVAALEAKMVAAEEAAASAAASAAAADRALAAAAEEEAAAADEVTATAAAALKLAAGRKFKEEAAAALKAATAADTAFKKAKAEAEKVTGGGRKKEKPRDHFKEAVKTLEACAAAERRIKKVKGGPAETMALELAAAAGDYAAAGSVLRVALAAPELNDKVKTTLQTKQGAVTKRAATLDSRAEKAGSAAVEAAAAAKAARLAAVEGAVAGAEAEGSGVGLSAADQASKTQPSLVAAVKAYAKAVHVLAAAEAALGLPEKLSKAFAEKRSLAEKRLAQLAELQPEAATAAAVEAAGLVAADRAELEEAVVEEASTLKAEQRRRVAAAEKMAEAAREQTVALQKVADLAVAERGAAPALTSPVQLDPLMDDGSESDDDGGWAGRPSVPAVPAVPAVPVPLAVPPIPRMSSQRAWPESPVVAPVGGRDDPWAEADAEAEAEAEAALAAAVVRRRLLEPAGPAPPMIDWGARIAEVQARLPATHRQASFRPLPHVYLRNAAVERPLIDAIKAVHRQARYGTPADPRPALAALLSGSQADKLGPHSARFAKPIARPTFEYVDAAAGPVVHHALAAANAAREDGGALLSIVNHLNALACGDGDV